jgi:hypothetical protein
LNNLEVNGMKLIGKNKAVFMSLGLLVMIFVFLGPLTGLDRVSAQVAGQGGQTLGLGGLGGLGGVGLGGIMMPLGFNMTGAGLSMGSGNLLSLGFPTGVSGSVSMLGSNPGMMGGGVYGGSGLYDMYGGMYGMYGGMYGGLLACMADSLGCPVACMADSLGCPVACMADSLGCPVACMAAFLEVPDLMAALALIPP